MDFHRFSRHAKFAADLFVQHSGDDQLHHFEFARRKQIEQTPRFILFRGTPSLLGRASQRAFDTFQEFVRLERFWQKIDRAGFHYLRAHWDVAVTSNEDKLLFAATLNQSFLELEPI